MTYVIGRCDDYTSRSQVTGTILYIANVLYCIVLYCIVLYCIVLYCIMSKGVFKGGFKTPPPKFSDFFLK